MPTPQTLREEFKKEFQSTGINNFFDRNNPGATPDNIASFFLARFKEFAEKELIGKDEEHHYLCGKGGDCNCGAKTRNSLRQHQRIIGKDYLK